MSDLIKLDETQGTKEILQKTTEILNDDIGEKFEGKKSSKSGLNISQIILLFRQYGLVIAVNFVILGAVCFLFLLQRNWIKCGNQDIGRIVEEKVMESIKKNMFSDNNMDNIASENNRDKDLKHNKNDTDVLDIKNGSLEIHEDNTKYVIEANRLYEQGCYESAAAFYEESLNKSMPFLNEDFVMYRLGDSFFLSERYDDALKVFQSLNSDYINSPYQFKSRLKIGECYAKMGEFKKARKALYAVMAQEGKCCSDDDKLTVVDSYFKIADYYMEEAKRLREAGVCGTTGAVRSLASK
jgi:tetratricopeptide (TPR) repeat protein